MNHPSDDPPASGEATANPFDWLHRVEQEREVEPERLRESIIARLKEVYDPELPVNIYDLGLIYRVDVDALGVVEVDMTLTTPGCPVAQTFPGEVEAAVRAVEGVTAASVDLVWDPPWCMDRLTDEVRLDLGLL